MNASIRFTPQTVKMLIRRLQFAYRVGDLRLVRHVSALLDLAKQPMITQVAETYSVARQTLYGWLKALMCHGERSLVYHKSPGRKPRLTATQKQRLVELIQTGPQAAGLPMACWTSLLIQRLIQREFGVLYNRYYVCELLHNLVSRFRKPALCRTIWTKRPAASGGQPPGRRLSVWLSRSRR
jgi:transposase